MFQKNEKEFAGWGDGISSGVGQSGDPVGSQQPCVVGAGAEAMEQHGWWPGHWSRAPRPFG